MDRFAEPHLGFPKKIFAVLDVWDHHVVLTLSFKLVSFLHLYLLFYGREYGQRSRYYCNNGSAILSNVGAYLGITITSTSASEFLRLFNAFWNLLHVLDVSWPSGYWGPSLEIFFGDFQCILLIIVPNFSHVWMNSMSHIFTKAIYWKSMNWALRPRLCCGDIWCHFAGIISL